MKLTKIFGSAKLNKNFIKGRFIFAATKYSVKPLPKAVTGVLKLINNQIENQNFKT